MIKKLKNHKNYKTDQYQIIIAILEGICTYDYDQKVINCLSRGGLTTVHNRCVPTFFMAEELFQNDIMGNPHKIDVADMADQLTKKPENISIFNNIFNSHSIFKGRRYYKQSKTIRNSKVKESQENKKNKNHLRENKMWQKHKIKFIKQVNLFLNTDGYFIGSGTTVSSTICNIYLSQDCLGVQKISLFWHEFWWLHWKF